METTWKLDAAHSDLSFKVKHLMISNVKGAFTSFTAQVVGDDFENARISAKVETQSIHTNDEKRDQHLRSADFFDAENFPAMHFKNGKITKNHAGDYAVAGELEIKGVTKPIQLEVENIGKAKDPWGNEKLALSLQGVINRKEFGLNWNAALEAGGVLVGEDIKLSADVQFVKE